MVNTPTTLPKEIDLDALLAYRHDETILRFMDNFDITFAEGESIFREMKLLLALIARYPEEYIFTHEPFWIIDEMWHTFLMYSKDYEDFCHQHFGKMIYHAPIKRAQKMKIIEKLETDKANTEEMLRPIVKNLYTLIHDYLGPETLIKWIKVLGEKYTMEYVNKIRKPL